MTHCDCSVVELRQYTLRPGGFEVLVDLFDRKFTAGLEAAGMHVLGLFQDLDDPDRFVWLRGFPDMPSRAASLKAFYADSSVWRTHRREANATMIDSDDVLLLRPAGARTGLPGDAGLIVATIYHFDAPVDAEFVRFFRSRVVPVVTSAGAEVHCWFETEHAENNFPQLPVRTGENVFMWLASFSGTSAYRRHLDLLARTPEWSDEVETELAKRVGKIPERLRLRPTRRFSALPR